MQKCNIYIYIYIYFWIEQYALKASGSNDQPTRLTTQPQNEIETIKQTQQTWNYTPQHQKLV